MRRAPLCVPTVCVAVTRRSDLRLEVQPMSRMLYVMLGMALGTVTTVIALGQQTAPADAVAVSPQLYTVKLENDRVRVLEYALPPGQIEPRHSHGSFVVRFLGDARIRATGEDGTRSDSAVTRGDIGWREPLTHVIENIGTTDIQAFIVEVKPCRPAAGG